MVRKSPVGFLLLSIAHPDRTRGIRYLLVKEDDILGLILMFPKAVLRQNKRGQRRGQTLFTKSLLIRWRLGERRDI